MSRHFNVVIVGLGANGSSAAWHLSKAGVSVCGIDRFRPPHQHGSSHGQSRIIRQAYYENPLYVPLVKEAYNIWAEIEKVSGKRLLLKTGGIMLGDKNAAVITGSRMSADVHDIAYEYLDSGQMINRFPAIRPSSETVGILEKDAGILFPEACIRTFLEEAENNGAVFQYNEQVLRILPGNGSVEVITHKETYVADQLIITTGAWMNDLLPELKLPLVVERQVLYWFKNRDQRSQEYFSPGQLPVYIWEYEPRKMFYGFPDLGDGIKIAYHHSGGQIRPDEMVNEVSSDEINSMAGIVKKYFNMEAVFNYSTTCMYTDTPDEDFIIDFHPLYKNICIASPCSGHGFKFSSLTGKILSDMATGNSIPFNLSPFSISRFNLP